MRHARSAANPYRFDSVSVIGLSAVQVILIAPIREQWKKNLKKPLKMLKLSKADNARIAAENSRLNTVVLASLLDAEIILSASI